MFMTFVLPKFPIPFSSGLLGISFKPEAEELIRTVAIMFFL
jgi:hypothetical protein